MKEVYLTGVATHSCVKATAEDAVKKGFSTKILKGCVSGTKSRDHGLDEFEGTDVNVISLEEFENEI